jgi:hypothetical protein
MMILEWMLKKIGQVFFSAVEKLVNGSCEQGITLLSSVKHMGSCSSSQLSDSYCLKKYCAAQGWMYTYG